MRVTLRTLVGICLLAGLAGPVSGGAMGVGGGNIPGIWREVSYHRGILQGDRNGTLTQVLKTNATPERALWRSGSRDPAEDWVQRLGDPDRAAYLQRSGAHTTMPDWNAFAVFGIRDDEDLSAPVDIGIEWDSFGDERSHFRAAVPRLRRVSRAGVAKRPLETWFGEIDATLAGIDADESAKAIRVAGVRRAGAVSTVRRSGPGRWTYEWTVSNRTAGVLEFSWPSVLTDEGEAFEGTLAQGESATLARTVARSPFIFAGPVKFSREGEVHPDFQAAAEAYIPRP